MSGYRGRTGPNFSEYLNNLNTLTTPFEDDQFSGETLDLNQDLAMFTNTDFTHFDIPSLPDSGSFNFELDNGKVDGSVKYEDLLTEPQQQNFNAPPLDITSGESQAYYSNYNPPIQPAPAHSFGAVDGLASPSSSTTSGPPLGKAGQQPSQAMSSEEKSRLAAEEDKRRRNTAASARFRVKKKQREQTLEKSVKEVNDKNTQLEAKVNQLEMENKWLKELITEKNGMQSKEEIAAAYHQFRKESEERDLKLSEHAVGVGTE